MKKLEELRKLKGTVVALATVGTMLASGITASAEGKKPTVQDVVDAMIEGNRISSGDITQDEAWSLEADAIEEIKNLGTNLLPNEISERYDNLKNLKGEERKIQLVSLAGICDAALLDGTVNMMTYPESLQFDMVCSNVCNELKAEGYNEIYSLKQSEMYGEDRFTGLDVMIDQSSENVQRKTSTYIIALDTDLGFYDDCFMKDENPNTAVQMPEVYTMLLSAGVAFLTRKKKGKEEKGKPYTKRKK